jgi:hypothetical protein
MSKHMDPGVDEGPETALRSTGAVDGELDDLLGEADRLRTADADPRRGRWPASDYY